MSKLIIILLLLFNLYFCEETIDGVRVFESTNELSNKNEFSVRLGEQFAIKIKSNPSTGFSWSLVNEEEIKESLVFIKSEYIDPSEDNDIDGKPGFQYFFFKSLQSTEDPVSLEFSYHRGASTKNAVESRTVKINIK